MHRCLYSAIAGEVALSAATAKSVIGVKAHANSGLAIASIGVGFDGATAGRANVAVELCASTFATNSPGTNSTSVTPTQDAGPTIAVGATAAHTWTSEPTVLTVVRHWTIAPYGGQLVIDFPLGLEPLCVVSVGYVLRMTADDAVNTRAYITFSRI